MSKGKVWLPGSTIGIVGGGQLGKMLTQSAKKMGFKVGILEPGFPCPAGEVADFQVVASYHDEKALMDFCKKVDVLTFEFENVDVKTLEKGKKYCDFPQGTDLLYVSQNRLREKEFLSQLQIPVAPFVKVTSFAELKAAALKIGFPCVLKTSEGGYDGKGQIVFHTEEDLTLGQDLLKENIGVLEKWLAFDLEISVMVVGNQKGEMSLFPVSENIHRHNILHESIVPARISPDLQKQAQALALQIAKKAELVGSLAVEMFVTSAGLFVNELAPRPHNSGHYSIELCNESQFDAHIKSICHWPLAPIFLLSSGIMVNILGEHLEGCYELLKRESHYHFHFYGKSEARIGRKMGHMTLYSKEIEKDLQKIKETKIWD